MNNLKSSYSILAKCFHWGFVFIFAYGIFKQIDNVEQLENIALLKSEILFALLFLFFLLIRFFYMTKKQKSSLPSNTSKIQKIAAKFVHYSMYFCLAAISITGLIIGLLFWFEVKNGIFIDIIISLHEASVSIIYWLIFIHVIAAIYHRTKNDGVWQSMVPIWKEKNKLQ